MLCKKHGSISFLDFISKCNHMNANVSTDSSEVSDVSDANVSTDSSEISDVSDANVSTDSSEVSDVSDANVSTDSSEVSDVSDANVSTDSSEVDVFIGDLSELVTKFDDVQVSASGLWKVEMAN